MKTSTPQRADDRARAMRRLRAMTIGTALAGIAATGGFGWLAATTHPGSSAMVASVAATPAAGGSTTGTSTTSGTSTAAATASPTSTKTGSSSSGVTSSSGRAQVSTGGS
jgi:hypothetical protein